MPRDPRKFLLFLILSAREIRLKDKFIFVYYEFYSCGTSEHCLWKNVYHKRNNSIGPLVSSVWTPHDWLKWLGRSHSIYLYKLLKGVVPGARLYKN